MHPCILVSAGDPAGVGYELAAAIAARDPSNKPIIIGDPHLLRASAAVIGIRSRVVILRESLVGSLADYFIPEGFFGVVPVHMRGGQRAAIRPGRLSAASGRYALAAIACVCRIVSTGDARRYGVLTMPVSKAAIQKTGIPFSGHTEYFARWFNVHNVSMLMIGKGRRGERYHVLLLTRHVPLRSVPQYLRRGRCAQQILATASFIATHRLAGSRPLIVLICGINPHAGEGGALGTEEQDVLLRIAQEVRRSARRATIRAVECPVLTEYAFNYASRHAETLIVCSYHDQGMVPLKLLCGHTIANVTIGLPFVRVSPGHGTAADIAGTGTVDRGPTLFAMDILQQCLATS